MRAPETRNLISDPSGAIASGGGSTFTEKLRPGGDDLTSARQAWPHDVDALGPPPPPAPSVVPVPLKLARIAAGMAIAATLAAAVVGITALDFARVLAGPQPAAQAVAMAPTQPGSLTIHFAPRR